ncbi:sugar transferase [Campylobacter molothri]|uniref:sugar transferase n=1 Tax=Campylobacter molothri TaxID=1032242 RepID=UPI0035B157F9
MSCPLCQSNQTPKELFVAKNAFTSSVKFNKNPMKIADNEELTGGGIARVIIP